MKNHSKMERKFHLEIGKKVHENNENWQMADKKTVRKWKWKWKSNLKMEIKVHMKIGRKDHENNGNWGLDPEK